VCQHCGYAFPPSAEILALGTILQGRYEIQELSHEGGTSRVYLAKDKRLYDRRCIVKQVKEPISSDTDMERFDQAILGMAELSFPNVAMILDHFVEGEYYFLVVDYIAGKTLSEVCRESHGKLEEEEIIRWAISMCDILSSIHKQDVTHGDISPQTIMLTDDGFIKFIDFATLDELRCAATGETVSRGRFGYTPPEQWDGKRELRSDIFALSATIYYLLTGFLPLSKEYLASQGPQRADFNPDFPPIRQKNERVSPELEAVLQKALQLDANSRYSSATEFAQDLKNLIKKTPILSVDCERLEFANIMPGRAGASSFTVRNDGASKLVGKLSSDKPWMEISPATLDLEAGEQEVSVTVDTSSLAPGFSDIANINIATNGGKKSIGVSLSVSQTAIGRALAWMSSRRWLVFLIVGIIIVASAGIIVQNTILKETTPATATVFFEDDFSHSGSGWEMEVDNWGESAYTNGEYLLLVSEADYNIVARTSDKIGPLGDFAIEVDARFASGPNDTWYGIGFRQQDKDNSYDFLINSGESADKASYAIFKQFSGTWSQLKDWTDSSYINKGTATNHLKVICKGEQIEVYANGHKLARVTDFSFSKGAIVFEAAKDQGVKAYIYFDNLKIYVPH